MEAKPAGSRVIAPRHRAAAATSTADVAPRKPRPDRAPRPPRAAAAPVPPAASAASTGEEAPRGEILAGDVHVASSTNIKTCAGAIAQKLRSFGHTGVIGKCGSHSCMPCLLW